MRACLRLFAGPTLAVLMVFSHHCVQADDGAVSFTRDIRTILSNKCFQCHGPDPEERKGGTDGLRLDNLQGALADLGGYAALVPGQPEKSALLDRVTSHDPDLVMPPPSMGKGLTPHEIDLLKRWIAAGAPYEGHWSYTKPVRPELPKVAKTDWAKNPIDRFILARLEQEGLAPQSEADCQALIRRVALDLTGLPPKLDEVDAFANDKNPEAYDQLIDRLLEKKAYGEHWARMWLDLARYADSAGYADDPPRTIWLFRDYVIDSLNNNKPFDQFTIEQIAGDLLPNPTQEQLIATAFHRNTMTNSEGGTNDEEFRSVAIVDRVNTTMAVWMGTTMACAQCHTHKFDPLTQTDYFRLYAIFNNTEDADLKDESPLLSFFLPEQQQQRTQWQEQLQAVDQTLKTVTPELISARDAWDVTFPRDLAWQVLTPSEVKSQAGNGATIEEHAVRIATDKKNDDLTVTLPLAEGQLSAIRLETLTDSTESANKADGYFILTKVSATITRPLGSPLVGRFVRIEIPGKEKILSLAEVEVRQGESNIAPEGTATQSTTAFEGPPELAIDGNTDGNYYPTMSTTHTAISNDPWWELDLKTSQAVDSIRIWNRTDGGTGERLKNFRIQLLDENRKPLWQQTVAAAPDPSTEFHPNGPQTIEFVAAVADSSRAGFTPDLVLKNPNPKQKGWSESTAQPHALTLLAGSPIDVAAGSILTLTIEQQSQATHLPLSHFRLSLTDDARAQTWGSTPANIITALNVSQAERTPDQSQTITDHYLGIAPLLAPQRKQAAQLRKQLDDFKPVTVPINRELPKEKQRVTRLQHRGNFLDLGEEVAPGTPTHFPPIPNGLPANRLGLAHWLISEDNPLTARVVANMYWEAIFGIGLVASSDEFGSQGDLPSHPELLDWLATELIRLKWDTKAFLKLLVTSAAYRQSSKVSDEEYARDPDNRLLGRGPRFRLSAEMIRDQALFASGLLSSRSGGPPVKPPQPNSGLNAAFGSAIDWQTSNGEDKYRRGLYTTWRRSNPYPSMSTFDAPNREVCTVRRVRTNTPLQALVTLNDPVYIEAAQAMARRLMREGGDTTASRATYGFRLCLARPPHEAELARLVALYEEAFARFQSDAEHAKQMATDPLGPTPDGMNVAELAAWTIVSNVLLNLDETLMKR
ncbi:DUF1553 domain-containing protein [Planctomicrobium piriforme]|uniref:F5/8 type C domain-containing protein n=1 Tax=Planctomicrobium piriforme TaxID=1576369 RepID=A0A1I3SIS1_9PLAN|nr:DUF1553 domain-containing protein [Planctomicrobium piriforme]SFJ58012.1 F5/8 type C domain-containing protein [Planctomicrobium piriforme]